MTKTSTRQSRTLSLLLGLASCVAWTHVGAVDAGSELRRFQDETQRRLQPSTARSSGTAGDATSLVRAAAAASEAQVYVARFEVSGVTRLPADVVIGVLQPFTGRRLTTGDLYAAADALMQRYRREGYVLAKVFIPPQAFDDTVRLDVEEGRLEADGIEVVNRGQRLKLEVARAILDRQLYADRPLERRDLERALLLVDDLPGTRVGSLVYPGKEVGTARLRAALSDEPVLAGNVDIDNLNSRLLGQERLGATLYLNSPGGDGDQWVSRIVTSGARSGYAYLSYLRPLGPTGMRIGGSVDHFRYKADAGTDTGEVSGRASDVRLYLTHPIVRSRQANLNLRVDASRHDILDRNPDNPSFGGPVANPFAYSRRRIDSLQFALSGDTAHDQLAGSISLFDVTLTTGRLGITGDAGFAAYDTTGTPFYTQGARTAGRFVRLAFNAQHLQHLGGAWSGYGRLGGQLASRNLDASQRMFLGGATSIAGYPGGELSGDQGGEVHVELRRDIAAPWGGSVQMGVFHTRGWLQRYRSPWFDVGNRVSLSSTGLQVTHTVERDWVLRGVVGWQGGGRSPAEQADGRNSDGRSANYRVWFQVIRYFGYGGAQ